MHTVHEQRARTVPAKTVSRAVSLRSRFALLAMAGLLCIITATLSVNAQAGKIYRWVDSSGHVAYGEHPPKGVKATLISTTTGKSSRSKAKTKATENKVAAGPGPEKSGTPSSTKPEAATQPPAPKKNPEFCERAKSNLQILNERARIRQLDENGEEKLLSDEEKEEQKKISQQAINDYC